LLNNKNNKNINNISTTNRKDKLSSNPRAIASPAENLLRKNIL